MTPVLIVGAGPVGLTAAVELARRGVECRVVDRLAAPRPGTRGCTVYQRTLETLDLMGVPVSDYVSEGVRMRRRVYHLLGEDIGSVDMGEPASPWPYPLLVGQQVTEAYLTRRLKELGISVERGVAASFVTQDDSGVTVRLGDQNGAESTINVGWVIAAEGSASGFRESLGVGWPLHKGFDGLQLLQVDARISASTPLPDGEAHMFFVAYGHVGCLPMRDGRHRIFLVHHQSGIGDPELAEISAAVRKLALLEDLQMSAPQFAWRVRLQSRLAESFRVGRCFLAGDSSRVFSPVYAQGMNTGIQDAFNLGWKLAMVAGGNASPALLDTYEVERRPVAAELLERTGRSLEYATGPAPERESLLAAIRVHRHKRTELSLGYPESPLSTDLLKGPGPSAGDRAPDGPLLGAGHESLFGALRGGTGWTLVAFDGRGADLADPLVRVVRVSEREDPAGELGRVYGTQHDSRLFLIRPDGYVGFRGSGNDGDALRDYLRRVRS